MPRPHFCKKIQKVIYLVSKASANRRFASVLPSFPDVARTRLSGKLAEVEGLSPKETVRSLPAQGSGQFSRAEQDPATVVVNDTVPRDDLAYALARSRFESLSAVDVTPGEMVGCYLLVRELAEGGMGVVYLARDTQLEREVAIKFIRAELSSDPMIQEKFRTEARAMARARHENLVTVHARGKHKGIPYVVMEYIEGTNLEDLLASAGGGLSLEEVLRVFRPLCQGITAIHQAGVIHRDIKPSNILIGSGFRIVITDLGIAQLYGDPKENVMAGTPAYLAPEVIQLGDLTHLVDIYALGALCFELLTGRPPFLAEHTPEVLRQQVEKPPPAPSLYRAGLPPEVDRVVQNALAKDPKKRPQSAQEFLAALTGALEAPGRGTHPTSALVVDDDPSMCELVQAILLDVFSDMSVEVASSGEDALRRLQRSVPSLVVTDLRMPGVNGFDITRYLRSLDSDNQAGIIVMTAVGGAGDWKELASIGANAFLVKPFSPGDLVASVNRLFGLQSPVAQRAHVSSPQMGVVVPSTLPSVTPPQDGVGVARWAIITLLLFVAPVVMYLIYTLGQSETVPTEVTANTHAHIESLSALKPADDETPKTGGGLAETTTSGDPTTAAGDEVVTTTDDSTDEPTGESAPGDEVVAHQATSGSGGATEAKSPPKRDKTPKTPKTSKTSSDKAQPKALDPRCERVQKSADQSARHLDWNGVLKQVAKKECWPNRLDAIRLEVRALKEQGRFQACVAAGKGIRDAKVRAAVSLCQQRVSG